jgi:hypothetical protein
MKLFQALKEKQRLVNDLSILKQRIAQNNQIVVGNERNYDPKDLLKEYEMKITDIINLKERIQTANKEIYPKIYLLNELKGEVAFLTGIPCKNGIDFEGGRYGGESREVKYESKFSRNDLDNMIHSKTTAIRNLQDEIDIYNHTVDV